MSSLGQNEPNRITSHGSGASGRRLSRASCSLNTPCQTSPNFGRSAWSSVLRPASPHMAPKPFLPNEPNIAGNPSKCNRYQPLNEPDSTSGKPPGGRRQSHQFQGFRNSPAASANTARGARDFKVSKLRRSSPSISTGVSEIKTLLRNLRFARRR